MALDSLRPRTPRHAASARGRHATPGRLRRWALTAVAATIAIGGGALVSSPAEAATSVSALTFNICGVVCHKGEVMSISRYTANKVIAQNASVAFLQEICYSQYRQIRALVEKKGYTAVYASQTTSGSCDNYDRQHGRGFGTAILVKGKASGRTVLPLPTPAGYEKRNLLGTTARVGGRWTFVAVVHASPSAAAGLDKQLKTMATFLNAKSTTGPVIFGGDFNALPNSPGMAAFYSPAAGGTGRFTELDQNRYGVSARAGAPTFDVAQRKIDYVFVSAARFTAPSATVGLTSMSDHRIYVGRATLL
jgi:endonuclease/exonuclease/phosphatase family metal-dependent hydrolase